MRFKVTVFKSSFDITLVHSHKNDENYPGMDGYQWQKDTVFCKLSDAKKYIKNYYKEERLTAIQRESINYELGEITIESLVDSLLDNWFAEVDELQNKLDVLEKSTTVV